MNSSPTTIFSYIFLSLLTACSASKLIKQDQKIPDQPSTTAAANNIIKSDPFSSGNFSYFDIEISEKIAASPDIATFIKNHPSTLYKYSIAKNWQNEIVIDALNLLGTPAFTIKYSNNLWSIDNYGQESFQDGFNNSAQDSTQENIPIANSVDSAKVPAQLAETPVKITAELQTELAVNAQGDLIYENKHGLTISEIAKWFTLEESNSELLLRLNGYEPGKEPQPGDKLIVPAYLLKNRTAPTHPQSGSSTGSNAATKAVSNH